MRPASCRRTNTHTAVARQEGLYTAEVCLPSGLSDAVLKWAGVRRMSIVRELAQREAEEAVFRGGGGGGGGY